MKTIGRRALFVATSVVSVFVVLLALAILAVVLIPVSRWQHPSTDATYQGFDRNLLYVDPTGVGRDPGAVQVDPSRLRISAPADSHPTIHLITTPLAFSMSVDVTVDTESGSTVPMRIGLWSPETRAGYFLLFDHGSGDVIRVQSIVGGTPLVELRDGTIRTDDVLGQYAPGHKIRVMFNLDKQQRTLQVQVLGPDTLPPVGSRALRMGSYSAGVGLLYSNPIPVSSGTAYSIGGWVENLGAVGAYAIGIVWLNSRGEFVASDSNSFWDAPPQKGVWTSHSRATTAPPFATTARIFLGTGASSPYLFGDVFLRTANNSPENLLRNGTFADGLTGWSSWVASKAAPADARAVDLNPLSSASATNATEFPELFSAFRPTISVSADSRTGSSTATVENYAVVIPPQVSSAEETERISDTNAGTAVEVLLVIGLVLTVALVLLSLFQMPMARRSASGVRFVWRSRIDRQWALLIPILFAYFAANAALFLIAPLQWDEVGAKIWAYVGATGSPPDLYYRPLIVTLAPVARGVPIHEAAFPYGPTNAYFYTVVGQLFELARPNADISSGSLDVLLKSFNVLFAIADAALIYSILRRVLNMSSALESAGLFVLNPALVFVISVWGTTESISLFFVFFAIWVAERNRPTGAYLLLSAAALTRPQMMVPAFLLGLCYLHKFGWKRSSVAIATTTIVTFLFAAPFELAIAPSYPVDYIKRTLTYHLANGQTDPNYLGLSPGYYSVWTLPLEFINHQQGLARMWASSMTPLIGSVTYGRIAAAASITFVLAVGAALLINKSYSVSAEQYLPVVAFGVLGWLLVTPGLISRYFVYAIAFIILTRSLWQRSSYLAIVSTLTVVTFVTAFGHLALDSLGNGTTASVLNPLNNRFSSFVFGVFSDDRFITLGTLSNLVILFSIGSKALLGVRPAGSEFKLDWPFVREPSVHVIAP